MLRWPAAREAHLYFTGAVARLSASAGTDRATMSSADGAKTPLQQTLVHCLRIRAGETLTCWVHTWFTVSLSSSDAGLRYGDGTLKVLLRRRFEDDRLL